MMIIMIIQIWDLRETNDCGLLIIIPDVVGQIPGQIMNISSTCVNNNIYALEPSQMTNIEKR